MSDDTVVVRRDDVVMLSRVLRAVAAGLMDAEMNGLAQEVRDVRNFLLSWLGDSVSEQ